MIRTKSIVPFVVTMTLVALLLSVASIAKVRADHNPAPKVKITNAPCTEDQVMVGDEGTFFYDHYMEAECVHKDVFVLNHLKSHEGSHFGVVRWIRCEWKHFYFKHNIMDHSKWFGTPKKRNPNC